jgi:hypothetical protein
MKDNNGNLTYDGAGEMIAFIEHTVIPGDTARIKLSLFEETPDTLKRNTEVKGRGMGGRAEAKEGNSLNYTVNIDSSNSENRTFDINVPVTITFSKRAELNMEKIQLSFDSAGFTVIPRLMIDTVTGPPQMVKVLTNWRENTVYTLGLAKGFAKDSAGNDVMPSRWVFRTKEEDDYGKITVHLLPKYLDQSQHYVLRVIGERDTVYQKPVTDTMVRIVRLKPAKYTFSIIVDKNDNGRWDTGDLLAHKQPEVVIPSTNTLTLKAGWTDTVDFEELVQDRKGGLRDRSKTK